MKKIKKNNDFNFQDEDCLTGDIISDLANINEDYSEEDLDKLFSGDNEDDMNDEEDEKDYLDDAYDYPEDEESQDTPHVKEFFTKEEKDLRTLEDMKLPHYVASNIKAYNVDYDELVSIAWFGYTKALNSFDKSRNVKFATYAVNCMRNEIFYILRKEKKHTDNTTSFHKVLATDKNGNGLELGDLLGEELGLNEPQSVEESILQKETNDLLLRALSYLKRQEQIVLIHRYGLNNVPKKTQKEVARLIGMSQANVSKMEKTCLIKLKLFLKKDMTDY